MVAKQLMLGTILISHSLCEVHICAQSKGILGNRQQI